MTEFISDIVLRGSRNKSRYTKFLKNLKKSGKIPLDTLFRNAHEEAFALIDCLECGRCCFSLGPRILNKDITRLARRTRSKPAQFIKNYLRTDEDGDFVFKTMPCPFLGSDNYCLIYEDRPEACRDYPHMNGGRQSGRINLHIENLAHCPAVILAVEFIMKELS